MREIATYLIGNLDEDGYLRVTREEIRAGRTTRTTPTSRRRSRSCARFDPPGIGAFDLPDCLLLQLAALGIENPLIEKIIREHWPRS